MKRNQLKTFVLTVFAAVLLAACGSSGNQQAETNETTETSAPVGEPTSYSIDSEASEVAWKGEVAGVYGHNGVIDVEQGTIEATGDQITGGKIVIDMASIVPMDSASYQDKDGARITDLQAHLMTGDFFLVEEHPTSTFVIKSQEGNKLIGDLTIRGTTREETIALSSLEVTPVSLTGTGVLVFDRQEYGVKWEHFVQDYVLSDDIEIGLNIVARK